MRPHVSAETLARFQQGDLSPRRNSRISAHLGRCSRCSELNEDLGGVTRLLASVVPPPIPEHLTARIQSALATEAAKGAAPHGAGTAGRADPADGRRSHHEHAPGGLRRSGQRPRLPAVTPKLALGLAATFAAVVIIGGGMYQILRSGSSGPSSSSAEAPSSASVPGAAGAPALGPALQYRRGALLESIRPVSTGTNFTSGGLPAQVTAAVTKYGSSAAFAGPMTKTSSGSVGQAGRPATFGRLAVSVLQGCVNRIAAGEVVLLVDVARYQDAPATIIVTEVSQAAPLQVWVVGTGCSAARGDVLRHAEMSTAG